MKRSAAASTPVLLRVNAYPKSSLREQDDSGFETQTESEDESEASDSRSYGSSDMDDDDLDDDMFYSGGRKGRRSSASKKKGGYGAGEMTMNVESVEGEATYADSAISGMFGKGDEEVLEDDAADDEVDNARQKRLNVLLSKTDKIVNRLNNAMQESMSNVLKAAEEATKADLEMKQKLEEEKLNEKAKAAEGDKGPSPAKTRRRAALEAKESKPGVEAEAGIESGMKIEVHEATKPVEEEKKDFLKSGKLRDYQQGGVEWLGALHDQGLNGILADEMGLGKTLQTLTFLYELHEQHRLWGPHLVVMPMSVLSSWKQETQRFLPGIFDIHVHHGHKNERAEAFQEWRRRMVASRKARISAMASASTTTLGSALKGALAHANGEKSSRPGNTGPQTICVCLTTYDIALKDQALLQRFGKTACRWGYLVVDEAHRLKNRASLLYEALKKVNASRRLMLSGTPLQNNLGELWSLLSFILPDIFSDIEQFVDWFNRPFEHDSDEEGGGAAVINKGNGKSKQEGGTSGKGKRGRKSFSQVKLQARRSVQDSLSEQERSLIVTSLHRIMKPFILRRLKQDVMIEVPSKVEKTIMCPRSALQKSIYDIIRASVQSSEGSSSGAAAAWRSPQDHLQPAKANLLSNGGGDDDDLLDENADERALLAAVEDQASSLFSSGVNFNNVLMHLRKLCNHPYLLLEDMATIPDELYFRYLVNASGKMCVLERLVRKLIPAGHKVLIFSQFTSTMDILQGFFHNLGINTFRLDGQTPREMRESNIEEFTRPDSDEYVSGSQDGGSSRGRVPVYLLSTRAGGVGINLQAADTVIFFDSDWNPQQDLQAMSRAHRLGQLKTVLVLRLVTCGEDGDDGHYYPSAEERILRAASHKLEAERIVLADGEFDMGTAMGSGKGRQSTKAAQEENKQLTELLVQDGGIMALFAKESDDVNGTGSPAAGSSDQSTADSAAERGVTTPAEPTEAPKKKDGMSSLDEEILLEVCTREGMPDPTSGETSLDASSTSSPLTLDKDGSNSTPAAAAVVMLGQELPSEKEEEEATPLLESLSFEQAKDWAPWVGLSSEYVDRIKRDRARRLLEKKAELLRQRKEREEAEAKKAAERLAALERKRQAKASASASTSTSAQTAPGAAGAAATPQARGFKRKLNRKVNSPSMNEDALWEDAVAAAEVLKEAERTSSSNKKRAAAAGEAVSVDTGPFELAQEDICVLCNSAWAKAAEHGKYSTQPPPEDEEGGPCMSSQEREQVMLICEGCHGSFHMVCVGCFAVPEGDWYCHFCEMDMK